MNFSSDVKNVTREFHAEFTNWTAVFGTLQMRKDNEKFVTMFYTLLMDVIKKNKGDAPLMRAYSHAAIKFLHGLNRNYSSLMSQIILSISEADNDRLLVDQVRILFIFCLLSFLITFTK